MTCTVAYQLYHHIVHPIKNLGRNFCLKKGGRLTTGRKGRNTLISHHKKALGGRQTFSMRKFWAEIFLWAQHIFALAFRIKTYHLLGGTLSIISIRSVSCVLFNTELMLGQMHLHRLSS